MKALLSRATSALRDPALRGLWLLVFVVLPIATLAILVGPTRQVEREVVYGTVVDQFSMDGKRGPVTRTLRVRLDSGEHVLVKVVERWSDREGTRVQLRRIDHLGGWSRTTYAFEKYQ